MKGTADSCGPPFVRSDRFLSPFVCECDVYVVVKKGELGVTGVVAYPGDGGWLGLCGQVILRKSPQETGSACWSASVEVVGSRK